MSIIKVYGTKPKIYNITYEVYGGSLTDQPITYTNEDKVILPTPTKTDNKFLGWYDNEGFTGDPVAEIPKGSTGNKVFYAKWQAKYIITETSAAAFTVYSEMSSYINDYDYSTYGADPVVPKSLGNVSIREFPMENCNGITLQENVTFFSAYAMNMSGNKYIRFTKADPSYLADFVGDELYGSGTVTIYVPEGSKSAWQAKLNAVPHDGLTYNFVEYYI